jgi:RimJ/RimL family protein N-acetyltransferase
MEDIKIVGKKIRLRPMEKKDSANKVKWFNDPEINRTLLLDEQLQLNKTLEWFDKAKNDNSRMDFAIDSPDGEPIGLAGLVNINRLHQTAEIYCVIGEKKYWGKGIMFETEHILINRAFKEMGLEKIWAYALSSNIASIITMKKLGFKIEGTLRKEKKVLGQRTDVIRVGLLKEEFKLI